MNVNSIEGYNVFVSAGATSGISILLQDGSRVKLTSANPELTMLRLDVLRNEKPVFYNTSTGMLYTGEEEVGEGE